jgi:hypothetical protein
MSRVNRMSKRQLDDQVELSRRATLDTFVPLSGVYLSSPQPVYFTTPDCEWDSSRLPRPVIGKGELFTVYDYGFFDGVAQATRSKDVIRKERSRR